jgi:hypothetical protein
VRSELYSFESSKAPFYLLVDERQPIIGAQLDFCIGLNECFPMKKSENRETITVIEFDRNM